MICKNCQKVEIEKDDSDGKWYEKGTRTLHWFKCENAPHKKKTESKPTAQATLDDSHIRAIESTLNDLLVQTQALTLEVQDLKHAVMKDSDGESLLFEKNKIISELTNANAQMTRQLMENQVKK